MNENINKIGRNEPCPCNSGKKYKHCCLNKSSSISVDTSESLKQLREKLISIDALLRARNNDLNDYYNEIEKYLTEHKQRKYKKLIFKKELINKIPFEIKRKEIFLSWLSIKLLMLSLIRSELLIQGIIQAINSQNNVMQALLIRAHFETTGTISYFLKYYKKYLNEQININQIHIIVAKLMHGNRIVSGFLKGDNPNFIDDVFGYALPTKKQIEGTKQFFGTDYPGEHLEDSINILTCIDSVDDHVPFQVLKEMNSSFREFYNYLSEYCHPNEMGLHTNIKESGAHDEIINLNNQQDEFMKFFVSLEISVKFFLSIYDQIYSLLDPERNRYIFLEK